MLNFLPGNTVYHLTATLNAMANPLMAFLAMFLPCKSKRIVSVLTILGCVTTSFILATALHSPNPLWGDVGGGITVVAWVMIGCLFSYVKVCTFFYLKLNIQQIGFKKLLMHTKIKSIINHVQNTVPILGYQETF